jgi:hypothetical protein
MSEIVRKEKAMIGYFDEKIKIAKLELEKGLKVKVGGKDKNGYILVDRWISKSGNLVDIWASPAGLSYTVGIPITDTDGNNMVKSIKSSQEAFWVFAEMLAK